MHLYQTGCGLRTRFNASQKDLGLEFQLNDYARLDQIEISLSNDTAFLVDLQLFGSRDSGESWIELGSTEIQKCIRSSNVQITEIQIMFNLNPSIWHAIVRNITLILLGCLVLNLVIPAPATQQHLQEAVSRTFMVVLGCTLLAAAVACFFAGNVQSVIACCWGCTIWLSLAASLKTKDSHAPYIIVASGGIGLVLSAVNDLLFRKDACKLGYSMAPTCTLLTLAGSALVLARVAALSLALLNTERDSAAYAAEWLRLARDPAFADDAARLQSVAQRIAERCRGRAARHFNRKTNPADPNVLTGPTPGTVDPARPVTSLDQLYAQAMGAAPVLQRKVAEWSAGLACEQEDQARPAPGAWLPARPRASVMERCVSLGVIKSPARAMEKAALCYGGDVSRLVDICRARVGFGGPADLSRYLERVAKDCRVVRIKNMMETDDGSHQSLGLIRNGYKVLSLPRAAHQ